MLPFLPFHTIAARRGDGLRPELLALFERHAQSCAGLSARLGAETPADDSPDASSTSDSHRETTRTTTSS